MIVTIYDKAGKFYQILEADENTVAMNIPDGGRYIEGHYPDSRLNNKGEIVYKPESPSKYHIWNGDLFKYEGPYYDAAISNMDRAIKAFRDRKKYGGVNVDGFWFHQDDASRIQQVGLVMQGNDMDKGLQWKTMQGRFVDMTPQLANKVFVAVSQHDINVFNVAEEHIRNMKQSSDPLNYDYSTGWPRTYTE